MPSPFKPHVVKQWAVFKREYVEYSDGKQYSRRNDSTTGEAADWEEVKLENSGSSSSSALPPKKLYLVLQSQADGEPKHWSLFVTRGESVNARGKAWQVKGDALLMREINTRCLFPIKSTLVTLVRLACGRINT
jgi:hypothetical protein